VLPTLSLILTYQCAYELRQPLIDQCAKLEISVKVDSNLVNQSEYYDGQ